ncbi:hypothetical protein ABZ401_16625 [Streptomyces sp. NPDC005892]|uniref:hypothetical protein n=1 Tax=Streptomyces sp. NPDC005892 TaxID=3155593 RepID=UPI0033F4E618
MRTTGYGRGGQRGRLPVWLRVLVVLAAGWGAFLFGQQVADGYTATEEYRNAPVCAAGSAGGSAVGHADAGEECVRREAGTVLGRRTGEHCTYDGTSGDAGSGTTTCSTYYDVQVERPGHTDWLSVGPGAYDEAEKGDRAEVRLWRGEIVGLEVPGHTETYAPSSQSGVFWRLAAGCLILLVGGWGVVSGRLSSLFAFHSFGLLFVAFGTAWLGSMALFGGHPLTWGFAIVWTGFAVFWTVTARRMG